MSSDEIRETKYLIIGNSAGGIGAAEAIRELDKTDRITIVSDEPYSTYSRPLISKYLSGERKIDGMLYRPADFYDRNNIELITGKKVVKMEPDKMVVVLDSGERIQWKKLLLATGGSPIVPNIKGSNKKGVFTFITLDNAKSIHDYVDKVKHAVVIGGGLIGISVTEALVKLGIEVDVVEMKDKILNTILDEDASTIIEENLRQKGVGIITGNTVTRITGRSSVEGVILTDGRQVPCQMVVIAIGVLPRTELALNTGIEVNRGIVVDRSMASSYIDIYACGDAAEAYDFIYNANRVTPILPNAYIGGRVAGHNMAGGKDEYPNVTAMNSLNYFGIDIASAGIAIPPQDEHGYEVISSVQDGIYRRIVLHDDFIVGMVFLGDIEKAGMIYGLMRDRIKVDGIKEMLLDDDFGLASFPEYLRRERLLGDIPQELVAGDKAVA